MARLFISYASKDRGHALAMVQLLRREGYNSIYIDVDRNEGILVGEEWKENLFENIRHCRALMVIHSASWSDSRWCFAELVQAQFLGKSIIPIKVDDVELPDLLSDRQYVEMDPAVVKPREDSLERLKKGLDNAGVSPTDLAVAGTDSSPYKGLAAFRPSDKHLFFGRGDETTALLGMTNRLRKERRLGLVVGPSGVGKSSVVGAGLVPVLDKDPRQWFVVGPFRPREDPFWELKVALKAAAGASPVASLVRDADDSLNTDLAAWGAADLHPLLAFARLYRAAAQAPASKIVLIVDQFEELLSSDDPVVRDFIKFLVTAAESGSDDAPVVLGTLRSDFLSALQREASTWQSSPDQLLVGPLSQDGLAAVIQGPAETIGLRFEPALVQSMIADTENTKALPLLAYTLEEMYRIDGPEGQLTWETYKSLGRITGSLARSADTIFARFATDPDQVDRVRQLLLGLARPAADGQWVRRTADLEDFADVPPELITAFVDERLFVLSGDSEHRAIEVAHEAIFAEWPTAANWLAEYASELALRDELERSAAQWSEGGRSDADLWTGGRLARARQLRLDPAVELDSAVAGFVELAEKQDRNRRIQSIRRASMVAAAMTVLAIAAVGLAVLSRQRSNEAELRATENEALALIAESNAIRPTNPALAIALAVESVQLVDSPTLRQRQSRIDAMLALDLGQPFPPLVGHEARVRSAEVSADGKRLVSAGDDSSVRVWDATSQELLLQMQGHTGNVYDASISSDGGLIASAGNDGTVRLWDADTGEHQGTLEGHRGIVWGVAFSPDGALLASVGFDRTVRLWDVETMAEVLLIEGQHAGPTRDVAFSPDGRTVVSVGADRVVNLWDVTTGSLIAGLEGHSGPIRAVDFSPDGLRMATGSSDQTVMVWDIDSGTATVVIAGHDGGVAAVAFSPDGTRLATASDDATVRLWNSDSGAELARLDAHVGSVADVSFSPDGLQAVSGGDDALVRQWDVARASLTTSLRGHGANVRSVHYSPDNVLIGSAGDDGNIRLWDRSSGRNVVTMESHDGQVWWLDFSSTGDLVASAGDDGVARVWSKSGELLLALEGHEGRVHGVAISPDDKLVASIGVDGFAKLWDIETGDELAVLDGHAAPVRAVAFSPDGKRLATAGAGQHVTIVWDLESGDQLAQLSGHTEVVVGVVFSPDGEMLATTSSDSTVKIWDAQTYSLEVTLEGHQGSVRAGAFSPDGKVFASASADQTLVLWDMVAFEEIATIAPHRGQVTSVDFSSDGQEVATSSTDRTVALTPLPEDEWLCAQATPYLDIEQVLERLPEDRELMGCRFID